MFFLQDVRELSVYQEGMPWQPVRFSMAHGWHGTAVNNPENAGKTEKYRLAMC